MRAPTIMALKSLRTPLFLFIAFILLLVVSLSAPILGHLPLFVVKFLLDSQTGGGGVSGFAWFGLTGYCLRVDHFNETGVLGDDHFAVCPSKGVGYTMSGTYLSTAIKEGSRGIDIPTFEGPVLHGPLSMSLILIPIACALAFLAFILSLLMIKPIEMNIRRARLATIWMTAIVAIVTTAATIMAFVLVGIVLTSMPLGVDVRLFYGDASWMMLGATIASYCAVISAWATIYGFKRGRKNEGFKNIDGED
ncbi:hypothetical protein QCA50_003200 [Cerrena zonata]|uniref:Uncharacterized protein n=1 Tax=Cerrena zonata TaxID=2478898 RepID=A0AAW0GVP8_9APHY